MNVTTPRRSELTFDEPTHTYRLNGVVMRSVTQTLSICGLYAGAMWFTPERAEEGRHAHTACEYDDMGTLDYDALDDRLAGYVESWRQFRRQSGFRPQLIEEMLWSERFHYAGRVDRIGYTPDGDWWVIDIKSGGPQPAADPLQTAAYQLMLQESEHWCRIAGARVRRACVYLESGGKQPRVKEFDNASDFAVWQSCLTLANWKLQTGVGK